MLLSLKLERASLNFWGTVSWKEKKKRGEITTTLTSCCIIVGIWICCCRQVYWLTEIIAWKSYYIWNYYIWNYYTHWMLARIASLVPILLCWTLIRNVTQVPGRVDCTSGSRSWCWTNISALSPAEQSSSSSSTSSTTATAHGLGLEFYPRFPLLNEILNLPFCCRLNSFIVSISCYCVLICIALSNAREISIILRNGLTFGHYCDRVSLHFWGIFGIIFLTKI